MGATKTEAFTAEQNEMAAVAKALAHPARIAILQHLLRVNSCICGDIVNELPLAQPTISQHLRELKAAGIIKGSIEGTKINYCIDDEKWQEMQRLFNRFFDNLVSDQTCC